MTRLGSVYGQALYDLARSENLTSGILQEVTVLARSFGEEPIFLQLLAASNLSKEERCSILDSCFRGKVHPYVLSFLKILAGKGYIHYFSDCCAAYRDHYNRDNGILPVTAVTAVQLTQVQSGKLEKTLSALTGKTVFLQNRVEPGILGGVRLDYDGKCLDDTVSCRLDVVHSLLKNTVL